MAYTTTNRPAYLWWANDFETSSIPNQDLLIPNSGLKGDNNAYCLLTQLDLERSNSLLRGGGINAGSAMGLKDQTYDSFNRWDVASTDLSMIEDCCSVYPQGSYSGLVEMVSHYVPLNNIYLYIKCHDWNLIDSYYRYNEEAATYSIKPGEEVFIPCSREKYVKDVAVYMTNGSEHENVFVILPNYAGMTCLWDDVNSYTNAFCVSTLNSKGFWIGFTFDQDFLVQNDRWKFDKNYSFINSIFYQMIIQGHDTYMYKYKVFGKDRYIAFLKDKKPLANEFMIYSYGRNPYISFMAADNWLPSNYDEFVDAIEKWKLKDLHLNKNVTIPFDKVKNLSLDF